MSFCASLASAYSLLAPWQPGWPASVLSSTRPMPQRGKKRRRRRKTQPLRISPSELPLWEPKAGPSCLISHVSHPRFFFLSEIKLQDKEGAPVFQFHLLFYTQSSATGTWDLGKIFILGSCERCAQCQAFSLPPYPTLRPQNSRDIWTGLKGY